MKIIDTHTHIYHTDFESDIDEVILRAKETGLTHILLPNIDQLSIDPMHELADKYPGYCLPMMGLHPTSVTKNWEQDLASIKPYFEQRKYVAVGEIGIDLYWDKSLLTEQQLAFEEQLRWSITYDLPVAIHSRNATQEVIECIHRVGKDKLRGVMHSFCGTETELEDILSLGNFYLGINGVVTFKNSTLPSVLLQTDLNHIIVETDAPYLAPMPYRGKRNEPSYTSFVIQKLSEIYGVTPEEVGKITSANAKKLFNIAD